MATAREKTVNKITERIPHKDVAYAYLELEAANANEFESLRSDALSSPALAHYAFAANAPARPKVVAAAEVAADSTPAPAAEVAEGDAQVAPSDSEAVEQASAAAAPTKEGLSPRERARLKVLARKEEGK